MRIVSFGDVLVIGQNWSYCYRVKTIDRYVSCYHLKASQTEMLVSCTPLQVAILGYNFVGINVL